MRNLIAAIALLSVTAVNLCSASVVTVSVESVVNHVSDPDNLLGGKVQNGDRITGSYTYDTSAMDTNTGPSVGVFYFQSQPFAFDMTNGKLAFRTDTAGVNLIFEVLNDNPPYETVRSDEYKKL